jgi:choline kinase
MKVIILAAGMGERLFPLTKNTPKSLLDLGGGVTVIESQLDNIKQAGIDEVVIVVGYRAEQVEAKIASIDGFKFSIVYNPFFNVSNNLVSAWFAREHMDDDFILLNGDDVFESDVMAGLLQSGYPITMVVDKKEKYDDDDMKVTIEDNNVTAVSKMIDIEKADGESIGMFLFRGVGRETMRKTLDRMVRYPHYHKVFYLAALQKIMDEGIPVRFHECNPEQWAEIDFHPDLSFIRKNIEKFNDVVATWKD